VIKWIKLLQMHELNPGCFGI